MALNLDFAAELRKHFGGDIRLDAGSKVLYSTDASIYQIEPAGVVLPRTSEDLQIVVELAAKHRVPLVPRGAGTSLAGQAIGEGLILDCSRWLDRILAIEPEQRQARVQPGVVLSTLNRAAAQHGLQFGPDPASADRATMGGVLANNATGAHSILYGMAADHVLAANVVLSDGSRAELGPVLASQAPASNPVGADPDLSKQRSRQAELLAAAWSIRAQYSQFIEQRFPRTWRNSAGYRINYLLPWAPSAPPGWPLPAYPVVPKGVAFNLAQLLAGSEGTLAVVEDLTVGLVPRPKHTALGILAYDELAAACDAVPELLALAPSAIELIPRLILESARRVPGYASQMRWLQGSPAALLVVEFSGDDAGKLSDRIRRLGSEVQPAITAADQAMVWATRKAGLGLLDSEPVTARPTSIVEDCAIPVEHLGSFVREMERLMQPHGASGGIYGHASGGCLHVRPVLDLQSRRGVTSLREIAQQTLQLTLRLGGSMTSEHGDGIARGEWLRQIYGPELSEAMLLLKHAADPERILNPGKMLDAPPMDTRLRYGSGYDRRIWLPAMDFFEWTPDMDVRGGLAAAIEQCNGQGACRKDTGVMCPSFQATRDEKYSTRGRANLLRALISTGLQLPPGARRRRDLEQAAQQALELCLGCKGCLAECPSGVDMARLKSDFLNNRYRTRRRPVRDYLFGYFDTTARLMALLAPALQVMQRVPGLLGFGLRALGIASERPLPQFSRRPRPARPRALEPSVLLLGDPFSHYADPSVEDAALSLLEIAGHNALPLATLGAGAALISRGFLPAARRQAQGLVDEITRVDPFGKLPLVIIEPSELGAVRHDFPRLFPPVSEAVAERLMSVQSVEEFLVHSGRLPRAATTTGDRRVLFHPHCHEKAEGRAPATGRGETHAGVELLRHCGYEVEIIDAGCCGMGGTFGYEAEHYEISQKIAALKLYPALRAAPHCSIAATGGACRMQITQGTGRSAEHPLVLAARALEATQ